MTFSQSFSQLSTRWRVGLLVAGLVSALALALVVFVMIGAFDYAAPLSDKGRAIAAGVLGSICAVILLRCLAPTLQLRADDVAASADQNSGRRRPVTTALELSAQAAEDASPMRRFLVQRSLEEGARALSRLRFPHNLPWRSLRRHLLQLVAVLAALGTLCFANWGAVRTIATRLLHPDRDIPPWSPLVFEVTPHEPRVIYGSDAELEVKISGGPVTEGVVLLTRTTPDTAPLRMGAFAMGGGRFGQKLQRVVQPVQIAFASGRARSPWIQVDVMRQPRIETVMIKVTPPAYTKLPTKEFALGTSDLIAIAGSQVEARVTSNRPLGGGTVTITPPRSISRDVPDSISTTARGEQAITLRWKVKSAALVRIDLKDITGALSAQPVELDQKLLPDQPPEVTLESPAGVVLATPESEVPLKIEAEDDFGVARVDLVRKLTGFRDRGRTLTEDAQNKVFSLDEPMNLAKLGVVPGQTLEFYAEAHDHNPTFMGISSSPVGRIQVISHEQYAEMIRTRTLLKEFQERFAALNNAMENVRAALDKAAKGDPKGSEEARQAMQKAQELAEALSKDFIAFESEKQIADEAKKIAELMQDMQQRMEKAGASGAQAEARKQLDEIGDAAQKAKELAENGKDMAAIGRVLEMAAEFRAMHQEQEQLTKGLEELSREIMAGDMRHAARLDGLANRQQQVLDRWKAWDKELRAAADALPGKFDQFKKEAQDFADRAEQAGIQRAMERAMERAKKVNTPDTFVNAQSALAGMDSLLSGNDRMSKACNNREMHFGINMEGMGQSMCDTLAQMLAGMCKRHGHGKAGGDGSADMPATGDGSAQGGGGESGFAMRGDSLLQAPLYGPGRMSFSGESSLRGEARGTGKGNAKNATVQRDAVGKIDANATRTEAKRQISLRDVPERYRDAVRRFYGEDSVKETSNTTKP